MDKTLKDGTVLKKARFLRTTCKYCGEELSKSLIGNGKKFCNKKCNKQFQRRHNKRT